MLGRIISAYIMPHPPVIVPEVGKGEESAAAETIKAMKRAADEIKEQKPDTIIITTPHGPVFQDYIYISGRERLEGDFGKFGRKDVKLEFQNNNTLVEAISREAETHGISAGVLDAQTIRKYKVPESLDHGALVPLYFIKNKFDSYKLVHIAISGMPLEELYRFGICIYNAVRKSGQNVVFVASGDLSHRLSDVSPYGYNKNGPVFDRHLVDSIKNLNITDLVDTDAALCENAGECGLRSFIIMLGALDAYNLESSVYSYEGPFGIGYCVAKLTTAEEQRKGKVLEELGRRNAEKIGSIRSGEDPYTSLARKALETFILEGKVIEVPCVLPGEMIENKAGTFVSLKKHGELRGCIGTTGPTTDNIASEIIQNAISSGTRDPRFFPVEADELKQLVYSVDVLKDAERIDSIDELDVIKYGAIVRKGRRSGLLLPNLEGVDTPEEQVSIALGKAGINEDENYEMERFEVIRHK